jgi:ArsR family transcriptional regulator, lead/cadmium/zinc/bismuth-responsive transcriptional repressor
MAVPFQESSTRSYVDQTNVCQQRCIHPEEVSAIRTHLLTPEVTHTCATLFAVLGDPTRLQVLSALLHAPSGELCVCDLAAGLQRDETTISHQLRVLRTHRIVSMRKVGRVVYYRLTDEHVRQLLEVSLIHTDEVLEPAREGLA